MDDILLNELQKGRTLVDVIDERLVKANEELARIQELTTAQLAAASKAVTRLEKLRALATGNVVKALDLIVKSE